MNTHEMARKYRACPHCKARRGKLCVTATGSLYGNGYTHSARRKPFTELYDRAFRSGRRYEKKQQENLVTV